ncbi:MAG: hydrogenase iron-sulfur subunit [Anaerolineales bacterium]
MTEPKIIGFLCNWCSYRGADGAGMARLKYPPNIKIVRVPCSGRISPELVLRTFREGADGVMVLGCHIGDCHYSTGNHRTAKRMPVLKKLLEYTGIDPERLYINWVSAAEGEKFAAVIRDFTEKIRALPPFMETMKIERQEQMEKEAEWTSA